MVKKIFCDSCGKELKQKEVVSAFNDFAREDLIALCEKCYKKIKGELENGN